MIMKQFYKISLICFLVCFSTNTVFSQYTRNTYKDNLKTYNLPKNKIYKNGWIDFNKNGMKDVYEDPTANIDDRIDDLINQMNIEEKTNQMVTLYGYGRVLKDDLPNESWKQQLWKDGMGAIDEHLNGFQQWGLPPSDNEWVWPASKHAWAINEVQRFFVEDTRLGIPTDFTNEGIRGVESFKATNFPTQLGLGTTWNRDLVRRVGEITGREGRLLGYTNVYAPILDVGRDQRWGRYEEIYGESPYLVAELGVEMTKGMQKDFQVASTAKHYAAYANNKGGREGMSRVDPQMSWREVKNVHMYPWMRAIRDAGMLGVMSSYNDYDGVPVQGSHFWLTEMLRDKYGFKGYVVSDSDAVEYLFMKHGTAANMKESVYQSVMAGLNVRCTFRSPDSYVLPLRELVEEGRIPMEVIDERVRDILRVKFLVGMFDNPYQMDLQQADIEVNGKENQQVALQASREGIVLLKNDDNFLPLDKNKIKKISITGPNANDASYALTHYGPLAVDVTTVYEGIVEKLNDNVEVLLSKGCDMVDPNWPESELIHFPLSDIEQAEIDKAVADARISDVAIVVLGENIRTAGENRSRSSLELTGRQLDLLQAVHATGTPTILVMVNGRPLTINWADKFVPAILEAWYPGSQGGTAVADILFGDYNPSGKLTVTFPKTVGQIPFNFPAKPNSQIDGGHGLGMEGAMTRAAGPLYHFGYGLSYTTFEYSDLQFSKNQILADDSLMVSFNVTNTGNHAGDEVVQMYTRDVLSTVTTYEKNLRGFERVHLNPGETKRVEMKIIPEYLRLLNQSNEWIVEPGEFKVMIGASSEDIRLDNIFTVVESIDDDATPKTSSKAMFNVISDPSSDSANNIFNDDIQSTWTGSKGHSLTISLLQSNKVEEIKIIFDSKSENLSKYKIRLSKGGGQFIDFTSKAYNGKNTITIPVGQSGVSDVQLIVESGKLVVQSIDL